MQIRKIALIYTFFMILSLFVFLSIDRRASFEKRDVVYYNDLLNRIEADLSGGRDTREIEKEYGCTLVMSKRLDDPELITLYRDEAFVLDLSVDGEYVGKVAWRDRMERYETFGHRFLTASVVIWILTLTLGYLLLLAVYISYVQPVRDLKGFSEELARGNLEASLPIRRYNLFGDFTEAFDIMREELKRAQKKRMEAEIARKELVSSLSHDIKTPVAVIEATCEVLEEKSRRSLEKDDFRDPREKAEWTDMAGKIRTISLKAGTIGRILTDLMHSNLEDSEKAQVTPKEEYASVIGEIFRKNANFGNISLKDPVPQCLVYMDSARMEQVIDNVVGNSVKYGCSKIEVYFSEVKDMLMSDGSLGNFIRILIKDDGPGVDEEDLPLIAQKYYRGKNASEAPGYGLGLYLVKDYMQRQGGDAEYYNDRGFTVSLMLRKV